MAVTNEISLVTIPVPHFRAFDAVTNEAISFRVFREDDRFTAVPQISTEERVTTGIPEQLVFTYWNHVVLAANNMDEETMAVIKNIILELEVQELV